MAAEVQKTPLAAVAPGRRAGARQSTQRWLRRLARRPKPLDDEEAS